MRKIVTIKYYNLILMLPLVGILAPMYAIIRYGDCIVENTKATPAILGVIIQAASYVGLVVLLTLLKF